MRAFSYEAINESVYFAYLAGIVAFMVVSWAIREITLRAPRRSVHQLAERYIGIWAGLGVAAARILAYALLVMLGVELAVASLSAIFEIDDYVNWISAGLILVLALPVMTDKLRGRILWGVVLSFIGVVALVAVLGFGLVQEVLDHIDFSEMVKARADLLNTQVVYGRYNPMLEAIFGAMFPAMLLMLISERILVSADDRRVRTRRQLRFFVPALVLILIQLYFAVLLELPGRRFGLPSLSMAYAFWGEPGQVVVASTFILTGLAMAYAAYRQLPRLLRELALDGLLPRRLAAEDAVRPRRLIVGIIAVLAAVATSVLDSTRAISMVFIIVVIVIAIIASIAMISRANGILNDSTDRDERSDATVSRWIFRAFGLLAFGVLLGLTYVQPTWVVYSLLFLLVPGFFLWTYRRGQGRVGEVLAMEDTPGSHVLPTRVHGIVLVERLDQASLKAITAARATRLSSLQAICVDVDPTQTKRLRHDWQTARLPVALTILGTPKGAVRGPIIEYVRGMRRMHSSDIVMVFVPRIISTGSWERFFVRHSTPRIISELKFEAGVVLTEVPYRLDVSAAGLSDDVEEAELALLHGHGPGVHGELDDVVGLPAAATHLAADAAPNTHTIPNS